MATLSSCLLLVIAACGGNPPAPSGAGNVQKIVLLIDFFPSGLHAPFYVAQEEGYFAKQGLDVTIQHVLGGTEVTKLLVAGKAQIGLADFATMAVANAQQNAGLEGVMGMYEQSAMAVLAPAAKGIRTPQDLKGKTIVDFAGSSTQIVWPVFLQVNNVKPADIHLNLVDPATRLALIIQGRADGAVGYFIDNEPQLKAQCSCDVTSLKWKDWGIRTMSNGIIAKAEYIKAHPDVIRGVVAALVKAMEFTTKDPQRAVDDLLKSQSSKISLTKDLVVEQTKNMLTIDTSPSGGGSPIGFMTAADWNATVDLMVKSGQMSQPSSIKSYYTNQFVPGAKQTG